MATFVKNPDFKLPPKSKRGYSGFDLEHPPLPSFANGYITSRGDWDVALALAEQHATKRNEPITIWWNANIVGVMHPET